MKVLLLLILLALFLAPVSDTHAQDEVPDPDFKPIINLGPGSLKMPSWRPDGEMLAVATQTGVLIFDRDFRLKHPIPIGSKVLALAWRPDNRMLAVETETGVTLIDGEFQPHELVTLQSDQWARWSLHWSPSSDYLAIVGGMWDTCETFVYKRIASAGQEGSQFKRIDHYLLCGDLAWSANGDRFAILYDAYPIADQTLFLVDEKTTYYLPLSHYVIDFAWQHHGEQLAFTTTDRKLTLWDADKRRTIRRIPEAGQSVDWSPDDSQLATTIKAGKKGVGAPCEGEPTWFVRAYNAIQVYDATTYKLLHRIEEIDYLSTASEVRWLSDQLVATEVIFTGSCFDTQLIEITDVNTGDYVAGFFLGGGSANASFPVIWSPDNKAFYWYLQWHWSLLNVSTVKESGYTAEVVYNNSGADWSPDSQFITFTYNGSLYHVAVRSLKYMR